MITSTNDLLPGFVWDQNALTGRIKMHRQWDRINPTGRINLIPQSVNYRLSITETYIDYINDLQRR